MVPFNHEFTSMRQLQSTLDELLGSEVYLLEVPTVLNRSARVEALIDSIITLAVDNDSISQDALTALAVEVRLIARMLHMYGFANAVQMTTEHNLVLSLDRLIDRKL
jgi:hypothetical protein